ncbi:hypothetical protein BBH56_07650 [Spiribacter roseus]|nr:hypothetical protein BBH56_07650 [Spiribacter roseus]
MTELLGASETLSTKTLRLAMHIAERSGYLRRKLIDLFIRSGFFDSADRLVELEAAQADQPQGLHKALITAMRDGDQRVEVAACHRLFLAEGDPAYLRQAAEVAAGSLGYQVAWPYYLRLLFIEQPSHASRVLDVLRLFEREDAQEHFSRFGKLCEGLKGCEIPKAYWQAYRLYWSKDWQRCLDFIERSGVLAATGGLGATFRHLHALCLEKSNRHAEAVQSFEIQNKALAEERYTPEAFIRSLEARRERVIPSLPEDERRDYFIMTGFPRSGTTLLENALAAHPAVSTAEETGALVSSYDGAFATVKSKGEQASEADVHKAALDHRYRYYRALDRHLDTDRAVKIDKTPILAANIAYLEKLFPEKRYVFSIRHPYDVVLSNFKQRYKQNQAMAAFNDIHSACELYDYVMSSWFTAFPGQTERVCYVRYDELVTDFEPTIRRVIDFLGVDWHEDVLNFTEHSKKRAVRTPSYANVRKGLTLGVQTSYGNYLFLFDEHCRSKLDPWVEFFGYSVQEPNHV